MPCHLRLKPKTLIFIKVTWQPDTWAVAGGHLLWKQQCCNLGYETMTQFVVFHFFVPCDGTDVLKGYTSLNCGWQSKQTNMVTAGFVRKHAEMAVVCRCVIWLFILDPIIVIKLLAGENSGFPAELFWRDGQIHFCSVLMSFPWVNKMYSLSHH